MNRIRRKRTPIDRPAPATEEDARTARIMQVGNLLSSIRIEPEAGVLSTVQSSLLEFRVSLILDGVEVPCTAEVEWMFFETDNY